ncbi:MAG: hypothetical protein DMG72_24700 [Acidobacteria bacterium]|nr:MAG: hypothetical protein DMG72_24700 [Acidobacteriota bacterium]
MSCDKSQYCAYAHVSAMLARTGLPWWLAMFEIELYFDDSGTDGGTPVAVAACYVSSKEQWGEFVRNWDEVRAKEGFDVFSMAEFVAKPEAGHKPFCHWDNQKKDRVYAKLASIINTRIRKGFALAVPKKAFDEHVFPEFKEQYASDHYTWAVKSILGLVENWRKKFRVTVPMQYVFHWGSRSVGQTQIKAIWHEYGEIESAKEKYGIVPNGVMFQDESVFKPLQAPDILAWQMQNHMRRTVMIGRDPNDPTLAVEVGFYSTAQIRKVFDDAKAYKAATGQWPWITPISARVNLTQPGKI